jgi:hypothetical protein
MGFMSEYDPFINKSWLVFLDEQGNPIGHIQQLGAISSRIIPASTGIIFADRKSFFIVDHKEITAIPHESALTVLDSLGSQEQSHDSFLWMDARIKDGKPYSNIVFRVNKNGENNITTLPGQLVLSNYCGNKYYAILSEYLNNDPSASDEKYNLYEFTPVSSQPILVSSWNENSHATGYEVTWQCKTLNKISILFSANIAPEDRIVYGIRHIDVQTGKARWESVNRTSKNQDDDYFNNLATADGSNAFWRDEANKKMYYINANGEMRILADAIQISKNQIPETQYTLFPDLLEKSVYASLNERQIGVALANVQGSYAIHYAKIDFRTGKELYRNRYLEWTSSLTRNGFYISDVLALR